MKTLAILSMLALSGCCSPPSIVLNVGGTVTIVHVFKPNIAGEMLSDTTAEETSTNRGTLEIPIK